MKNTNTRTAAHQNIAGQGLLGYIGMATFGSTSSKTYKLGFFILIVVSLFLRHSPIPNVATAVESGYQVEYLNNKAGMRQNFVVAQKPSGIEPLTVKMELAHKNLRLTCRNNELIGTQDGTVLYCYKDLKVWDANQTLLLASMQLQDNTLARQYPLFGGG